MPSTTDPRESLATHTCSLPDGRTLAYAACGAPDGVPVVAHHGTPGSRLFAALFDEAAAAADVRLFVPDRPGAGRSSPPPSDWTWRDWGADLTALREAASIDRAAVLGFSGGGPFAVAAAERDWVTRLGLVSTVVPPADNGLATLSRIPYAIPVLFRVSAAVARVVGPDAVVGQYTDRDVPEPTAAAGAADFHEALRQGPGVVARETRAFGDRSLDPDLPDCPVRAWHGTRDENTPIGPAREFVEAAGGRLVTSETDHLGTLLDRRRDALAWLGGEE